MKRFLFSNKGFSLIELMVVVAIIAILASFAIPQYQTFQAKARQKEGLTLLNSYYVAAKATEAESGLFYGNFVATGFNPAGQVHYRVTAANAGIVPASGPNMAACITTAGAACAGYADWNEVTQGSFAVGAASNCTPAVSSTAATFLTCVSASIRSNPGTDQDTWSVNQRKEIINNNDGIR